MMEGSPVSPLAAASGTATPEHQIGVSSPPNPPPLVASVPLSSYVPSYVPCLHPHAFVNAQAQQVGRAPKRPRPPLNLVEEERGGGLENAQPPTQRPRYVPPKLTASENALFGSLARLLEPPERVKLLVGVEGENARRRVRLHTTRTTLTMIEGSVLAAMFAKGSPLAPEQDAEGCYLLNVLDGSGEAFSHLLNYLRDLVIDVPSDALLRRKVEAEAALFGLYDVVAKIRNHNANFEPLGRHPACFTLQPNANQKYEDKSPLTALTLSFLFKPHAIPTSKSGVVVHIGSSVTLTPTALYSAATSLRHVSATDDDGELNFRLLPIEESWQMCLVRVNTTVHVTLVIDYEKNEGSLYVNGKTDRPPNKFYGPPPDTSDIIFGCPSEWETSHVGGCHMTISHVLFQRQASTPQQIEKVYSTIQQNLSAGAGAEQNEI